MKNNILFYMFWVILFAIILATLFTTTLLPYDEIWCFQNTLKTYQGITMYTNTNIIHTPLFFLLGALFFHLFTGNLLTFRLFGAILYIIKFILIYIIFKKLNVKRFFACFYVILAVLSEYSYFFNGANYNILAMCFTFLGIILFITSYSKKYYHYLQGAIIFLVFFTKQTIGVYYALGVVVFELLELKFSKEFFKNQFKKLATFLPLLIFSLGIMYVKGNLFDFFNMCFGSIFEFGSSNSYFDFSSLQYIIPMISIILSSIWIYAKNKNLPHDFRRNLLFFICISLTLCLNMLPLANTYHTCMSFSYSFILFIYIINFSIADDIFNTHFCLKLMKIVLCIIILFFIGKLTFSYFSKYSSLEHFDKNHPFYPASIDEENKSLIDEMTSYISKRKTEDNVDVLVLSHEACLFMVPLNINNNEFDLFFTGNLGYNGIQNSIEKISNMENTEFLIFTNEEDRFYQEPDIVLDYIINNFKKTGEFLNYSIYINE